jgi:hypothetical protein
MNEQDKNVESSTEKKFDQTESTYHSLLNRIKEGLESAEEKTWEGIKYEIEQAIELEAAAEEMSREEIALLAAYLKKDLKSLTHYVEETGKGLADWLKFDAQLLEQRFLDLLLSVADKTTLEQQELEQHIKQGSAGYMAGEYVMPGTFACDGCGELVVFSRPQILNPCAKCNSAQFMRVTARKAREK